MNHLLSGDKQGLRGSFSVQSVSTAKIERSEALVNKHQLLNTEQSKNESN
ncbi:MAG: hypothetical protein ACI9M1_000703 [Porticoccaceae bacterium]|jgi:hypothetical protein